MGVSMKVNKRKFIIIIVIAIILVLIPPVVIMKEVMHWKLLAKDTDKKISQIEASELETKLMEKLKNSKLNVEDNSFDVVFEVCDKDIVDNNKNSNFLTIYYDLLKNQYSNSTNPYEGYILACVTQKNSKVPERVFIPCFKVESDSKGKVQNIKYVGSDYFGIGRDLSNIINDILREQYGVKSYSIDSVRYFRDKYQNFPFGERHYNYSKDMKIYVTDDDFGAKVLSTLCKNSGYTLSEYEIKYDLKYDKVKMSLTSWK